MARASSQPFQCATYCRSLGDFYSRSVKASLFCRAGPSLEAEPFHITNSHVDNAPVELPLRRGGRVHHRYRLVMSR